jgi:hypothetical protein
MAPMVLSAFSSLETASRDLAVPQGFFKRFLAGAPRILALGVGRTFRPGKYLRTAASAFRRRCRLLAIRPLNETLQHFPRQFSQGMIASRGKLHGLRHKRPHAPQRTKLNVETKRAQERSKQ